MGTAALVLGIVSIIIAIVPYCGLIAFLPAIIGLILGIVDVVKKSKSGEPKGVGVAGIILTAIAVVFVIVYNVIITGAVIGNMATDSSYSSSYYNY